MTEQTSGRLVLPERLHTAAAFFLGDDGARAWVDALPGEIDRLGERWDLVPRQVLDGGVMSCCVRCRGGDGRDLVLKLPLDAVGGDREGRALARWDGRGVPRVVHREPSSGATLMDFVAGQEQPPDLSVADFARLWERLPRVEDVDAEFPGVASNVALRRGWATDRFAQEENAAGRPWADPARRAEDALLADDTDRVLLHGDLQPKNVLRDDAGELVALDPLPVVGDPHYDAAFWCVMVGGERSIAATVDELATSVPRLDRERLHAWAHVVAVYELRPYLPASFSRHMTYLEEHDAGVT